MALQEKTSIWDIDVFTPLRAAAERVTGARSGAGESTDVSLRIIAEHARTMTFMVSDGVRPSNQERGYVLRRIIRRVYSEGAHCSISFRPGPSTRAFVLVSRLRIAA